MSQLLAKNLKSAHTAIVDLNGTFRGKRLPATSVEKILGGQLRLPLSSCNVDIWGEDIADSKLVFASGDSDGICQWTGRAPLPANWLSKPTALIPLWMFHEDGTQFFGDPRQVLASVMREYEKASLTPVVATELEFYLTEVKKKKVLPPKSPRTGVRLNSDSVYSVTELEQFDLFLDDVYAACETQDIPVDAAIAENGAGQFEINLHHTNDVLKAADDALFFKRNVKGIARKHGYVATFMAKPFGNRAGNGMHIHMSLLDTEGNNVFDDGTPHGSNTMRSAIGGLLQTMQDTTLIFAPHLNSYRRLTPRSHAPTLIGWGYENRTAAIRIPGGPNSARRIEHRVSGSDANPYLVLAALLGSALQGIQKSLDPGAPIAGNGYQAELPAIPSVWDNAIQDFRNSEAIKHILPEEFIQLFADCKQQEADAFATQISPFEYDTYMESV